MENINEVNDGTNQTGTITTTDETDQKSEIYQTDASGETSSSYAINGEVSDMFQCQTCQQVKNRSEAQYPTAKKPSMCRICAEKRRKTGKKEDIPPVVDTVQDQGKKGATDRVTVFLSQRAQVIMKTLAEDVRGVSQSSLIEGMLQQVYAEADETTRKLVDLKLMLKQSKEG